MTWRSEERKERVAGVEEEGGNEGGRGRGIGRKKMKQARTNGGVGRRESEKCERYTVQIMSSRKKE